MHRLLFTGCFIVFSTWALAQHDDSVMIRKIADEILVNSKAYDNLNTLTKTIGARLSGSPQTYISERWAQKALEDAGADKVYLQECRIPHWVRGGKDEAKLITGSTSAPLKVLALGNSVGTGAKGITAPVMLVNSFDELEQRQNEVKGKIVFYNYKFNPKLVRTFLAYADAVRYRALGASRAAKYGAVGVLVRSMTESTDNNPHTGAMRYIDSFPKIPALAVGLWDADKLASTIEQNTNATVFLKTNAHSLPDTVGYNVIGEITGTVFPDQIITVGGHLDSWDPAEGAHDDGAGCVHSIEVLRAIKASGYKPWRTIRVVLFSDEENTGGGSSKYATEAKAKNEKHVFALESDAGGFTPRGFSVIMPDEKVQKMRGWLPLLQEYGVYEIMTGGAGADVEPLNEAVDAPVGELLPDSQRYFDYHHAPNDVFENVNKRELELGAVNMAALIYLVDKYGL